MSFFAKVWAWIKAFGAEALDFSLPIIKKMFAELGTVGLQIIKDSVLQAEAKGGKGSDKFAYATKIAKDRLADAAIDASIGAITVAIESAVEKYTK